MNSFISELPYYLEDLYFYYWGPLLLVGFLISWRIMWQWVFNTVCCFIFLSILFWIGGDFEEYLLPNLLICLVFSTLLTVIRIIRTRKIEAEEAAEHKRAEAQRKADAAAKKRREEAKQKRIKELNEKYGEPFGTSVYNKKVVKGMSDAAVEESWGTPKLIKNDSWYYRDKKRRILSLVTFKKNKVSNIVEKSQLVDFNMSKKDVIAIWGEPGDEKETVFKTTTKLRLYYFPRTTRQNRTVYGYEVKLEDDMVVGWKELD